MALQNSGTIKMDQIGGEFGGPKPYRMADHYRGGARVPANIPGNTTPGNPGTYTPGGRGFCNEPTDGSTDVSLGVLPETGNACGGADIDPNRYYSRTWRAPNYSIGASDYCNYGRGSSRASCGGHGTGGYGAWPSPASWTRNNGSMNPSTPPTSNPPNPPTTNPPVGINTKVPGSGTIKMTDFYGGRKS